MEQDQGVILLLTCLLINKKRNPWYDLFSIFERFEQLFARKTKLKGRLKTGFYDINFLETFVAQIIFDATYLKIERIYVNQ